MACRVLTNCPPGPDSLEMSRRICGACGLKALHLQQGPLCTHGHRSHGHRSTCKGGRLESWHCSRPGSHASPCWPACHAQVAAAQRQNAAVARQMPPRCACCAQGSRPTTARSAACIAARQSRPAPAAPPESGLPSLSGTSASVLCRRPQRLPPTMLSRGQGAAAEPAEGKPIVGLVTPLQPLSPPCPLCLHCTAQPAEAMAAVRCRAALVRRRQGATTAAARRTALSPPAAEAAVGWTCGQRTWRAGSGQQVGQSL